MPSASWIGFNGNTLRNEFSHLKLKVALSLILLAFLSGVIVAEPLVPVVLLLPILWFLVRRTSIPPA